jgi:hypothetical protein
MTRVSLDTLLKSQLSPIPSRKCVEGGSFGVRAGANFGQFFPTRREWLQAQQVFAALSNCLVMEISTRYAGDECSDPLPHIRARRKKGNGGRPYGDQLGFFFFSSFFFCLLQE